METRIVPFYGDQLQAVKDDRGIWVALDEPCANVGIDYSSQLAKLRRKSWARMAMITISQGIQPRACLDVRSVPMWLATIDAHRVRADLRDKLSRYQCEAAEVLARAFLQPEATASVGELEDLRRRVAEVESRQWGFVHAALSQHDQRLAALEAGQKRLRSGARQGLFGRQGGRSRLPRARGQGRLLPLPGVKP